MKENTYSPKRCGIARDLMSVDIRFLYSHYIVLKQRDIDHYHFQLEDDLQSFEECEPSF
jgi:hypothetical protein